MTPTPTISIIIPAYNAADTLPLCLDALCQQIGLTTSLEIIVVDDGSTDDTARLAQQAGVTAITQANAGAAAARNRGARVAKGDLLLFTDADCVPALDWAAQMIIPFSNSSVIGAKGVYKTEQSRLTPRFVQLEYQDRYDRMVGQPEIDFIDTYAAAYRRDIFLEMGGFDTSFPGASVEDQEFSFRLVEAGYRLVFVPAAVVVHRHDRTWLEYAKRKYWIGYWKTVVMRRHPSKLAQDSHTPQILKGQLGLAALSGSFLALTLFTRQLKWLWLTLGTLGAQLLSSWSFYSKVWRRDSPVILIAPFLVFIRAWALGLGFLWGSLRLILFTKSQS